MCNSYTTCFSQSPSTTLGNPALHIHCDTTLRQVWKIGGLTISIYYINPTQLKPQQPSVIRAGCTSILLCTCTYMNNNHTVRRIIERHGGCRLTRLPRQGGGRVVFQERLCAEDSQHRERQTLLSRMARTDSFPRITSR